MAMNDRHFNFLELSEPVYDCRSLFWLGAG